MSDYSRPRIVFEPHGYNEKKITYSLANLVTKQAKYLVVGDNALSDIAIFENSFVIIEPQDSYELSDVIYCIYRGNFLLRQLGKDTDNKNILRARNAEFKDIVIEGRLEILGKVTFSLYFHSSFTPLQLKALNNLLKKY